MATVILFSSKRMVLAIVFDDSGDPLWGALSAAKKHQRYRRQRTLFRLSVKLWHLP
jgi:hypothetical protein